MLENTWDPTLYVTHDKLLAESRSIYSHHLDFKGTSFGLTYVYLLWSIEVCRISTVPQDCGVQKNELLYPTSNL